MARPPRIEYSGAYYHVIDRGIERRTIFAIPADYERFLALCAALRERFKVDILAYCVLPNHYHLLLRTSLANLSRFMKELNGDYSKYYNIRCGRIGPLFAGRYKALLIQDDAYALAVSRYIHLNPVKAGLAEHPQQYEWSSYREYLGKGTPGIADTSHLLAYFHGKYEERIRQLRKFTTDEDTPDYSPASAKGGVVVGSEAFMDWLRKEKIPRVRPPAMAKWAELRKPGSSLKASIEGRISDLTDDPRLRRKLLSYALKNATPLSLKEVADMVGMRSANAVTRIAIRLNRERSKNRSLQYMLDRLDARLRSGQ